MPSVLFDTLLKPTSANDTGPGPFAAPAPPDFDCHAARWDAEHGPESVRAGEFAARIAYLRGICADLGRPRVLDLGCATGVTLQRLADLAACSLGIDYSPEMIVRARRLAGRLPIRFETADAIAFCMSSRERFDLVVLAGVLEHLPDTGDALAAVRRVLTARGRLVIISPHPWNPLFRLKLALDGGRGAPPARHLTPAQLQRLARSRGLDPVGGVGLPYAPWQWLAAVRRRIGNGPPRSAATGLIRGGFAIQFQQGAAADHSPGRV